MSTKEQTVRLSVELIIVQSCLYEAIIRLDIVLGVIFEANQPTTHTNKPTYCL